MFVLVTIDDDIPVLPERFQGDSKAELKKVIKKKYVDRVIPRVGLCIDFYDFVRIKDAFIYPGDNKHSVGEAYYKVEFQLVVFQPIMDEWLVGSIVGSTHTGIRVSLGFTHDVMIPSSNLRTPYVFDERHKTWVWQYRGDQGEIVNFFYESQELIRFRVTAVTFPEATCPGDQATRGSPMEILGAVDRDGLGCISWWPDASIPGDSAGTSDKMLLEDGDLRPPPVSLVPSS